MFLGFMTSLAGIFQDIAIDSLAIDILPTDQQARANGLMWGSKIIGISATVVVTTWLINNYSFFLVMFLFGIIVTVIMGLPAILKERPGEKLLPWSNGEASPISKAVQLKSWRKIFSSLLRVFVLQ